MRKIKTTDVFVAMRALRAHKIQEEIKPFLIKAAEDNVDVTSLGVDSILHMIGFFAEKDMEHALYEVLSGPFEMSPEDVGNLELEDLSNNLKILAEENDLKNFLKALSGLISSKR